MKRILLFLLAFLLLIPVLAAGSLILFRDVPGGVYLPKPINSKIDSYSEVVWVELGPVLPVMRAYGPEGTRLRNMLLLPFGQKALALYGSDKDYIVAEDGTFYFVGPRLTGGNSYAEIGGDADEAVLIARSKDNIAARTDGIDELRLVPVAADDPELARRKAGWQAARDRNLSDFAKLERAEITPAWQTSMNDGMVSFELPRNHVTAVIENAGDAIALEILQRRGPDRNAETRIGRNAHVMTIFATTDNAKYNRSGRAGGFGAHPDIHTLDGGIHVRRKADGFYHIEAERRIGDSYILAKAETDDPAVAADAVGIIRRMGAEKLPLEPLTGGYIPTGPAGDGDALHEALRAQLAPAIAPAFDPGELGLLANRGQTGTLRQPVIDAGWIAPAEGERIDWQLLRSDIFTPPDLSASGGFTLLASAGDRDLQLRRDNRTGRCRVDYQFPIAAISGNADLVLRFETSSINLPACQDAAAFFARFDLAALNAAVPASADEAGWLPHYRDE